MTYICLWRASSLSIFGVCVGLDAREAHRVHKLLAHRAANRHHGRLRLEQRAVRPLQRRRVPASARAMAAATASAASFSVSK